ncbi:SDR family NAD(P)-dependent oxidoreductase [Candidatus Woesearchaeota archaeon]|nr:SDR family NAD(P)-dependent oxidoreductase [Candidatus Woesearchaeota archaeon]
MAKTALITGASSGIGRSTALLLASEGYDLVLVGRNMRRLRETEREVSKFAVECLVRQCDVTRAVEVHNTVNHALKKFSRLDVLVNNAGYGVYGAAESMSLKNINGQMLTNYFGTVLFMKECLDALKETGGSIVNVASIAGLTGFPRMAGYVASKHAVVGFSESLHYELLEEGVSVSCVCPGKVKTAFFDNESFKDVPWAKTDSGLEPKKVADTILKAIKERKFLYPIPKRTARKLLFKEILPKHFLNRLMKKM